MEILAPAGNWEALERAAAAGADAVYLGYASFSARAGAGNFDGKQLREAVRFAHLHHMRVHVTLNTLVKDGELAEIDRILEMLGGLRVDGVLIQDLGILRMARHSFPDLPVHASTQMAIHNAAGVRFCREAGMTRAVLARECSLAEIRRCCREGIEIEVFAHGAQCVSVSGECLFSSMLGDRSGNRGRCAQPCRLQYAWQGQRGAWLSPRDICLRDDLDELSEAGVASAKIEGRLKPPSYVAAVTQSYRRGGASTTEEREALLQAFNRGGFMRGYAMGSEDADVIDPERVNHTGIPIGHVACVTGSLAQISLERPLHDGDLLRPGEKGEEARYAGAEEPSGGRAILRLRPGLQVEAGETVFRLSDQRQIREMEALPIAQIPVWMRLRAMPGEPLKLTVSDDGVSVTVTGETVQQARNRAISELDVLRSLTKLGGTPFICRDASVETEGAFVPVSALNAIRRDALEQLERERISAFSRPMERLHPMPEATLPAHALPPVHFFRTTAQGRALAGITCMPVWHPEDYRTDALERDLEALPANCWFQLPAVCKEDSLEALRDWLKARRKRFAGIVLGSVGQLGLRWPLPFAAGAGIPVMNRQAAAFLLELGCVWLTASPELTGRELRELTAGDAPIAVPAWGRTQLMLLHHCPARTAQGLKAGHARCDRCDRCDLGAPEALRGTALTDRKGAAFPLLRERLPEGCLVRLMNSVPLDLRERVREAGMTPCLEWTDEDPAEIPEILASAREAGTTSGHWQRPVT